MPTLEINDGTILYTSQTIVEYLDSISKDNKLYPAGGSERFYVLRRLDIDDSLFELPVQITIEIWQDESARRPDLFAWLWLNFQVSSIGPMFGQCGHFMGYAPEKIPFAIDRYQNETKRLYGVLNKIPADNCFLARDYSIADMAVYPWIYVRWLQEI